MKKKKVEKVEVINCITCTSCIFINDESYCKTKIFDENTPRESGKVSTVKDCSYFRKKIK